MAQEIIKFFLMENMDYQKRGKPERKPELANFAANVVGLMIGLNMSQHQFADYIKQSRPIVSNWVRARTEPKYNAWKALERVSGYSREELLNITIQRHEIPKTTSRSLEMVQEPELSKYEKPLFRFDASEAEQAIFKLKNEFEKLERRVKKLETKG